MHIPLRRQGLEAKVRSMYLVETRNPEEEFETDSLPAVVSKALRLQNAMLTNLETGQAVIINNTVSPITIRHVIHPSQGDVPMVKIATRLKNRPYIERMDEKPFMNLVGNQVRRFARTSNVQVIPSFTEE